MRKAINLAEKLRQFSDQWSSKVIAQMNDYHIKLVRFQGEFVWHSHVNTDEVFLVLEGAMTIHLRNENVVLNSGELFVVPRGIEHKTSALQECKALLVEKAGTLNTGDRADSRTALAHDWI